MFNIKKIDLSLIGKIQNKIDQKTKPQGALGELENLALTLALINNPKENKLHCKLISIDEAIMLVFAGDHGIAKEGISIAPSEVTQQMVENFLNGGAAINCFCKTNDMKIKVIDAGLLLPVDNEHLLQQSLGRGTKNFVNDSAMTIEKVNQGLEFGRSVINKLSNDRSNHSNQVFGFGEMGIGNTASAAAIQCLITGQVIENCVGRGTGIDDVTYAKKIRLLKQAVEFHQSRLTDKKSNPIEVMAAVGGFEIVQMVGAMLAAAESQSVILVDGFISTAAALLATKINANSRQYMIFCHKSEEQGHQLMLNYLSATPLLSLGLRLGEGTGAALAMPLLRAAVCFYNDMASFESAGVSSVVDSTAEPENNK
jgi:nicotinate-nucleotide--dimethylbenzimidazole phosphoribosyltransferase